MALINTMFTYNAFTGTDVTAKLITGFEPPAAQIKKQLLII